MLAPEHRLYLPFSLPQLLVDVNGKALPKPPSISAQPPTLQELVDHLTALATNSLPLALAHSTLHSGSDQGLGLLSGSPLSDIITALAVFGTRYDESRAMAHLPTTSSTASNSGLHGIRGPVASLPPAAGRLSASGTAEPEQSQSLAKWRLTPPHETPNCRPKHPGGPVRHGRSTR
jgi:hypothetical protein